MKHRKCTHKHHLKGIVRHKNFRLFLAIILALTLGTQAFFMSDRAMAVTINMYDMRTIDPNNPPVGSYGYPENDQDASGLIALMGNVATYYQDIFEESGDDLDVYFYYDDSLESGVLGRSSNFVVNGNGRPTQCYVRFNPDANWFFDSTPFDNSEFNLQQTLGDAGVVDDLPIDLLETGYKGSAVPSSGAENNWDLWSVALHEMGHGLGLNGECIDIPGELYEDDNDNYYYKSPTELAWDSNVYVPLYNGPNGPDGGHLDLSNASMYGTAYGNDGKRFLPTMADIAVIAELGEWDTSYIDLPRKDFMSVSGSSFNTAANWSGNHVPDGNDDVYVRHGGTTTLSSDIEVGSLTVEGANSVVNVGTNKLLIYDRDLDETTPIMPYPSSGSLNVADGGSLVIQDGGKVINAIGNIGYSSPTTGSGIVTVTGTDSTWENTSNLYVGVNGDGILNIEDNGLVKTAGLSIGNDGTVNLDGGTLELTNGLASYDTWNDITFTSGEVKLSGGTVTATAATTLSSNQTLTVTGSSTTWNNGSSSDGSSDVIVNSGNLNVLQGALVSDYRGYVGNDSYSDGNVTVAGTWTHSNKLYIGNNGKGTLTIQNGGTVYNTSGYLGAQDASSEGTVTVQGGGSWENSEYLYVGTNGKGTLNIQSGGEVSSYRGYIGYRTTQDNAVDVAGTWTNDENLYIGGYKHPYLTGSTYNPVGNGDLDILPGGQVENEYGYIGGTYGSSGTVTVNGYGTSQGTTRWDNNGRLYVGFAGDGELTVENGAEVTCTVGSIGYYEDGTGTVTVKDNATWDISEGLIVGYESQNSTQEITNAVLDINTGGQVNVYNNSAVSNVIIGYQSGSAGIIKVDNDNSSNTRLESDGIIYVGFYGTGELQIKNGGSVTNEAQGYIGRLSGASGKVEVSGSSSEWVCDSYLYVGYEGDGELVISNGGLVDNYENSNVFNADVGYAYGSSGVVTVEDSGSRWESGKHVIGNNGSGELYITDGGVVETTASAALIAHATTSSGAVEISGGGSQWITTDFAVGVYGDGTLSVSNGGKMECTGSNSYIGLYVNDPNDPVYSTVTVSGNGSIWENAGNLCVGLLGEAELYIQDYGLVTVGETLTIDYDEDADGYIRLSDYGKLALYGNEDDSLEDFLSLVSGDEDAIQWYNGSAWASLDSAIEGTDYSLEYQSSGNWTGYTLLTVMASGPGGLMMVNVPEPSTVALLLSSLVAFGLAVLRKRNKG